MFGYFGGEQETVFTCLSHDIVAHEATHALIDGLRPHYLVPSSPDQAAFHEGFSDVVALLSVFQQSEIVELVLLEALGGVGTEKLIFTREQLQIDNLKRTALMKLAEEMGSELTGVRGEPLRHSLKMPPSEKYLKERLEPHERGEVLVAAMLTAFLDVWLRRLFPYAGGGVDRLDRKHVVREGSRAAEHLLNIAIRALDYTPPVDLQFGEYLTALLTADADLNPDDSSYGYRVALKTAFKAYGIDPIVNEATTGTWDHPKSRVSYDRTRHDAMSYDVEEVFRFVWENRQALGLECDAYTYVQSVRKTMRVNADGFVVRQSVAEYVQKLSIQASELRQYGLRKPDGMNDWTPVVLYGGGSLIFDDYGRLVYNIGSGVRSGKQQRRLDYLFEQGHFDDRGAREMDLSRVHRLRGGGPSLRDPYLERRS